MFDPRHRQGMIVRRRGTAYLRWVDSDLPAMEHSEIRHGGMQIDVKSRLSRRLETQLFIGVYRNDGDVLYEEFFPDRKEQQIHHALSWGVREARTIVIKKKMTLV